MTREIKFRAWAEDWAIHKMQMFYDVQCAYDSISNEGDVKPHDQWTSFSTLLNDPDIKVMQFTGLKDKNEKEIYEGDVVKYHCAFNGAWIGGDWIVRFGEANTTDGIEGGDSFIGFFLELLNPANPKESYRKEEHRSILGIEEMLEIYGNIYETPELLKKEN